MRVLCKGDERFELERIGTVVVTRRFDGDALIDERRLERRSVLRAKWDADQLCASWENEGFERAAGSDATVELDDEELMAALLEDPDDVETYLVYADWLAERGDAWGELMSVQHALATLPRIGAEERRAELSRREMELLYIHAGRFWGWLGETIVNAQTQTYARDGIDGAWHCGFLRSATVRQLHDATRYPVADILDTFLDLPIARLLFELHVQDNEVDELALSVLVARRWPHLRTLGVSSDESLLSRGVSFAASPLVGLLEDNRAPELEELNLTGISDAPQLCEALSRAPRARLLRRLKLYRGRFDDASIDALARVPFERLDELVITGVTLPDDAAERLRHLAPRVWASTSSEE